MKSYFPVLMMVPALLAGCADTKQAPRLQGDRIDVTLQPTLLQVNPAARGDDMQLPAAVAEENWGQTGGNAAHAPGQLELPEKVVRAWSYRLGGGSGRGAAQINAPVVHSGRLFALNTKGQVAALDAKKGDELWTVKLPLKEKEQASLGGGLAVLGNLLFVTTGDGQVFALTASSGKQVWSTDLSVPLRSAPAVEGERVYVTSHDNRMFVLNALDGALLWTHSGMEETLGLLAASAPAVGNGVVAVPYSSGEVYVMRASDGRYIWHDTLSSPFSGQDPESTVSSISAPPVIADGLLYAVGLNGGLSAYGIATGQRFWKADITTSQLPLVAGTQIFVLTDKGELASLNRKDGAVRWVADVNADLPKQNDGRYWSGPVYAGGRLIVGSSDGFAVSIDPQNGKRVAATDLGDPVAVAPVVADGGLYFLTDDGRIICFRAAK